MSISKITRKLYTGVDLVGRVFNNLSLFGFPLLSIQGNIYHIKNKILIDDIISYK